MELLLFDRLLKVVGDSLLLFVQRPVGRWVHWQRGVRLVGSQGRYLTTRVPPWEQKGLPPIVDIRQIAHS